MLLTREEMTFDFQGAKLDPTKDRELLEWMFNQFLYGEVTGIHPQFDTQTNDFSGFSTGNAEGNITWTGGTLYPFVAPGAGP